MSVGRLGTPCWYFFFFQAEDGIRDLTVTGVQTCALPIYHILQAHGDADDVRVAREDLDACHAPRLAFREGEAHARLHDGRGLDDVDAIDGPGQAVVEAGPEARPDPAEAPDHRLLVGGDREDAGH